MSEAYKCDVCFKLNEKRPETTFFWNFASRKRVSVMVTLQEGGGNCWEESGDVCQYCVCKALGIIAAAHKNE